MVAGASHVHGMTCKAPAGSPSPAPQPGTPPATQVGPLPPDHHPISALNERAQIELITDLTLKVSHGFSGTQPLYTCQATCRTRGRDLQTAGEG